MKNRIIFLRLSLKKSMLCFIVLVAIGLTTSLVLGAITSKKNNLLLTQRTDTNQYTNIIMQDEPNSNVPAKVVTNTERFAEEYKGFKILGKISIPKIKLTSYILADTNDKSLAVAVTKLCGPLMNTQGNFCIAGHNYKNKNMFGEIHKLSIGDSIYLYDTSSREVEYKVYDIFTTNPKDVDCLKYENTGSREITLVTCTTAALKRLIIKAVNLDD